MKRRSLISLKDDLYFGRKSIGGGGEMGRSSLL